MIAKEKAKELVDKFQKIHFVSGGIGMTMKQSIQCAIIAVDEIIKANPYSIVMNSTVRFWQEVKTELEKL